MGIVFKLIFFIYLFVVTISQYSPTCQNSPFNTYPYCNPNLSISERINDLYPRLTLHEKNNLTNSNQGGVLRLAIPPLQVNSGCIHGATWKDPNSRQTHPTTQFPQSVTLAQSWSRQNFRNMGRAVSDEVRAIYNEAHGKPVYDTGHGTGAVCWGPNVNICRDSRWGRCQETYGEDPLLTSELSREYVYNLQFNNNEPKYWEVAVTCKHFNVHGGPDNSGPNWNQRASFDSIVRYDDWYLTFQPAFKSCADVNVASFMCSYNEINGVPACGNPELLQEILRNEWGWNGFVVSDCGATPQIYSWQNYTRNFIEAAQVAIKAGTDWNGNCGTPDQQIQDLYYGVINGTLNEYFLERAVKRVLKAWFKLGLMDPPINTFDKLTTNDTYNQHIDMNYNMAVESVVLLENRNNILPLNSSYFLNNSDIKIGLIGPCINNIQCHIGDYSENNPPYYNGWILPLKQIMNIVSNPQNVYYASGCNLTSCNDLTNDSLINVLNVVSNSDIILYFGGISVEQEAEMRDRTSLQLPYNQSLLFKEIYNKANGKEIISIISYGAPFIDDFMFSNSNALVGIGYLGMRIGVAIFDILLGNKQPSGKTVITWYKNVNQLPPIYDYNMKQKPFGRTYRYFNSTPYYTFGYGLSYTEFKYNNLHLIPIPLLQHKNNKLNKDGIITITPCQSIKVNVMIQNIGNKYISDDITQIYIKFPSYLIENNIAPHTDNIRLVNFTRTNNISPNEIINISLIIKPRAMVTVIIYDFTPTIEPGIYNIYCGDMFNVNGNNMLTEQFEIVGDPTPISDCE